MPPNDPAASRAIRRDGRDLRRGVAVNAVGHVVRLAGPVLLVLVTERYGIAVFGAFVLAQAIMLLATRVAALGLDKALLWWMPRLAEGERRAGIAPVIAITGAAAIVVTLALVVVGDARVLALLGQPAEIAMPLRIVALALLPRVWIDVLAHAAMGRRRMEVQVLVGDALVPIAFPAIALASFGLGCTELGLAVAWVVAHLLGLAAARAALHRMLGESAPAVGPRRLPGALWRYAAPMWLSELSSSFVQRLDTFLVQAFTADLALVGAWGVVTQVSNSIRAIRRSFDPIVVAIIAEVGVHGDRSRLRAALSDATFLVLFVQMPVFAFVLAFAGDLVPLFGEGFEVATTPIVILAFAWLANGVFGMAGAVVTGSGHAKRTLVGQVFVAGVLTIAGIVLIPAHGLVGAAWAVAIATTSHGLLQLEQMRRITGGLHYDRRVAVAIAAGLACAVPMGAIWWIAGHTIAGRAAAFAAFAIGWLLVAWRVSRAGWLVAAGGSREGLR